MKNKIIQTITKFKILTKNIITKKKYHIPLSINTCTITGNSDIAQIFYWLKINLIGKHPIKKLDNIRVSSNFACINGQGNTVNFVKYFESKPIL